jgi:isopenicillin-N epimerase
VSETITWGVGLRPLWAIEDGLRFINHGAFGAMPRAIATEQSAWRERMERNTARFFMHELSPLLRRTAEPVAAFLGTAPERLGFVVNATAAINAIARSLDFAPGDEIILTDHVYNAVRNTWRYVAGRTGAILVEAAVGMPVTGAAQALDAITGAITARTRLVVVDHVASASAVEFPVAAISQACRARGIPLLVDGAHTPGLLDLDVDAIDADWYVGNFHKWICAPKGAAFVAVARRPTAPIHPLAISHAYGQGFVAEFDKIGTHDPSAILSVPAAIRFHEQLGGAALRQRNRAFARDMALRIASDLGTGTGAASDLFHAMATIRLPFETDNVPDSIMRIHDHLYDHHRIEAAISALSGILYLRISVQAYNDVSDYAGLGDALRDAIGAMGDPAQPHQPKGTFS